MQARAAEAAAALRQLESARKSFARGGEKLLKSRSFTHGGEKLLEFLSLPPKGSDASRPYLNNLFKTYCLKPKACGTINMKAREADK
jgi:hypothetical protein